jgi:hypothetical protein
VHDLDDIHDANDCHAQQQPNSQHHTPQPSPSHLHRTPLQHNHKKSVAHTTELSPTQLCILHLALSHRLNACYHRTSAVTPRI